MKYAVEDLMDTAIIPKNGKIKPAALITAAHAEGEDKYLELRKGVDDAQDELKKKQSALQKYEEKEKINLRLASSTKTVRELVAKMKLK